MVPSKQYNVYVIHNIQVIFLSFPTTKSKWIYDTILYFYKLAHHILQLCTLSIKRTDCKLSSSYFSLLRHWTKGNLINELSKSSFKFNILMVIKPWYRRYEIINLYIIPFLYCDSMLPVFLYWRTKFCVWNINEWCTACLSVSY